MPHNQTTETGPFESLGWLSAAPHDFPVVLTGDSRVDYHLARGNSDIRRATQIASWVASGVVEWDEFLSHRINSACSLEEKVLFSKLQRQFRGLFDGNGRT